MKRADAATRIRWARKLLGSNCNRASVEGAVSAMLSHEARTAALKAKRKNPTNKIEKAAVRQVANELRRLNATLRNSELPARFRELLPIDLLKERSVEIDNIAKRPLSKPRRPGTYYKKKAAQLASLVLQEHDIKRITTRGKLFCKLAAAIYGDQSVDLFDQVRFYHNVDHLDASED